MTESISLASPDRQLVKPRAFEILKCACRRGRRKSQSMISTSAPVWARVNAVLIAVVVLPSEGWLEVTRIVRGAVPADESKSDVRRWRYDSAMGDLTSLTIASAVVSFGSAAAGSAPRKRGRSVRTAGIKASAGKLIYLSTSSTDLIVSSRKSSRNASPIPATNDRMRAINIVFMRGGPNGARRYIL